MELIIPTSLGFYEIQVMLYLESASYNTWPVVNPEYVAIKTNSIILFNYIFCLTFCNIVSIQLSAISYNSYRFLLQIDYGDANEIVIVNIK